MNEEAYERKVEKLMRQYSSAIASIARAAIPAARGTMLDMEIDADVIRDDAREIVTTALLNDEAWVGVHATDISDIAYEAVEHAWREQRSAEGTHHMVDEL